MVGSVLLIAASLALPLDTLSREAIQAELGSLVRIDTVLGPDGDSVQIVGFSVDRLDSSSALAPFLTAHGQLVWYLASHTKGAEARMVESPQTAPAAVRDSIVAALRTDAGFGQRVHQMLADYMSSRGRVVEGYSPKAQRKVITAAELNRVAARFFYPDRVSATGDTLFTHICAGVNGINDLPHPVDPMVEAFVFDAVATVLFAPESPLMGSFEAAMKLAKASSESRDPTTRIRRAQGALWVQLERDPHLTAAIASGYERHRPSLPFTLAPAAP